MTEVQWAVVLIVLQVLLLVLEFWLGKTTRLKSNSTLELAARVVLLLVCWIFSRNDKEKVKCAISKI